MISCRRASELISLSLDRPLGLGECLALGLHLCGCGMCRVYRRQAAFLQRLARAWRESHRPLMEMDLPAAAATRIARVLAQEQGRPDA
jgi:hypothetical protein